MNTTASTYHGPPVTLEAIQRAMALIEEMPPPPPTDPIHLTKQEMERMADALGLVRANTENAPSSLMGIPIVVVDENHPIARLFTWKQRIERTHPLLKGWKEWTQKTSPDSDSTNPWTRGRSKGMIW